MKKNKNTLTDSEKQVMELLWKEQKPMTSMEIAEQNMGGKVVMFLFL